jgi:biotin transport system substrate-specific component
MDQPLAETASMVQGARATRPRVRCLLLAALMCGMTVAGAQLRIPLPFVPLTLQTFFVILSGMLLGPRYAALSQSAYLLLGLAGLPVFSQGGGLGYVLKPTFGYLLGYPLAAAVVGGMIHGDHSGCALIHVRTARLVGAGVLGIIAIFVPGVLVLYLNLNFIAGTPIAFSTALWSGFLVFLPGDALKLTAATIVYRALQRLA